MTDLGDVNGDWIGHAFERQIALERARAVWVLRK